MTISSTTRKAGPFIGNGTAATFPFSFKVVADTDLQVVRLDQGAAAETVLVLDSDYTAALNADQDTFPGGSITLSAALATGFSLIVTTAMDALQTADITNAGGFYPDVITGGLDSQTIVAQQHLEQLDRSLKFPVTDAPLNPTLPTAAARAGKILAFDANGNPALIAVAAGGIVPGAQAAPQTVDGSNRVFTFIASPGATPSPVVFSGGIFQNPGADYSVPVYLSGSTWQITFTVAPSNGPVVILMFA